MGFCIGFLSRSDRGKQYTQYSVRMVDGVQCSIKHTIVTVIVTLVMLKQSFQISSGTCMFRFDINVINIELKSIA